MRKIQLLIAVLLLSAGAFAQTITGVVNGSDGKPMNGATVSLLHAKDSSVVKLDATKEEGRFRFSEAKDGNYLISVTNVGHSKYISTPFAVAGADVALPAIALTKSADDLKGVTVTARRPIVEVKADKTIVNVEGTINSVGSDALELLRKAPGVTVDKDDNLSLSGKNGVQVYIDGRPTPLSGQDLANYLRSIQSSNIESIEMITNPSAKYEAAGNAGIINIRLKKNKSFGTNINVNDCLKIDFYPKYNGGITLNHRDKNVNIFGTYSIN